MTSELSFQKDKQRVQEMSDLQLAERARDPNASATERMLVEAEIARRGFDPRSVTMPHADPVAQPRRRTNLASIIVIAVFLFSIIAGLIEEMGVDAIEWLRDFFSGRDGAGD